MSAPVARLPLPAGSCLEVRAGSGGWLLDLMVDDAGAAPVTGRLPAAGASSWLADRLSQPPDADPVLADDFRLRRFAVGRAGAIGPGGAVGAGSPAGAVGQAGPERPITADQTHRSVVVGERVVVKWLREVDDAPHPALQALSHLAEVGFDGVPASLGALTWLSPSGRELPCALVTGFLPEAVDGWESGVAALESGAVPTFPAAYGRLAARLHAALGSPSSRLPLPVGAAGVGPVRRWHADSRLRLTQVEAVIGELDRAPAGPGGGPPRHPPSELLATHRTRMETAIDRLLDVRGRTPVQHVHGDLHVGQILTWPGGLAVVDFDGNPALGGQPVMQPAARDVAQLLLSLDQLARIADRRSGYTRTDELAAWSVTARAELLVAYQAELAALERPDVLDARLLAAFIVEQACRDLLYAARFLPRWAYATTDGLATVLDTLP